MSLKEKKFFLLDMDGTIYLDNDLFDGTLDFLSAVKSSGGRYLFVTNNSSKSTDAYVKKLESFDKKRRADKTKTVRSEYDEITAEENLKLYDLFTAKLGAHPFDKRPANPVEVLKKGRDKFIEQSLTDQVTALLNLLPLFGRHSGGNDLRLIGGNQACASSRLSSYLSNWKKSYKCVRIIDQSSSGLYEKPSVNLLDLI